MNAAERFENQKSCALDEIFIAGHKEEVVVHQLFTIFQLLLSAVKVVVDEEALEELGDGISVGVGLLLDNAHHISQNLLPATRVDDHAGGEIAQKVRRKRLDGIQVTGGGEIQKEMACCMFIVFL